MEIKTFLFGCGVFNYAFSTIYNEYAVGIFEGGKMEFAVFIFGNSLIFDHLHLWRERRRRRIGAKRFSTVTSDDEHLLLPLSV